MLSKKLIDSCCSDDPPQQAHIRDLSRMAPTEKADDEAAHFQIVLHMSFEGEYVVGANTAGEEVVRFPFAEMENPFTAWVLQNKLMSAIPHVESIAVFNDGGRLEAQFVLSDQDTIFAVCKKHDWMNLAKRNNYMEAFVTSVKNGNAKHAQQFMMSAADAGHLKPMLSHSSGGHTALHWAIIIGHSALARMLLEIASVEAILEQLLLPCGVTPLHVAVSRGRLEMTRMLVEIGSNDGLLQRMLAVESDGKTPVQCAQYECKELLEIHAKS